jgi:hypothetical protein
MITYQFKINNFNISLSKIDDNIYIKVVDNISYQIYENNIDINDIVLPFNKNDILDIIVDCFLVKENCKVFFLIKENNLKITFDIIFNSKYKSNFYIILIEKKNEKKDEYQYIKELEDEFKSFKEEQKEKDKILLSLIEQNNILKSTIETFMKEQLDKNNKLESIINCCTNVKHYYIPSCYVYYQLNSTEIIYDDPRIFKEHFEINNFYQLNKLILKQGYYDKYINFSNKTLKILILDSPHITKLQGLDKLPSLEIIKISGVIFFLRSEISVQFFQILYKFRQISI